VVPDKDDSFLLLALKNLEDEPIAADILDEEGQAVFEVPAGKRLGQLENFLVMRSWTLLSNFLK
jgi:hypothetical protein